MSNLINNTIQAYSMYLDGSINIDEIKAGIDEGLISESLLIELENALLVESNASEIEKALNLKLHPDYAKLVNDKGYLNPDIEYGFKDNVDTYAHIYGHGSNVPKTSSAIKATLEARRKNYFNKNIVHNMGDHEVVIGDYYDGDILDSTYTVDNNGHVWSYHACGNGKNLISKDFNKFVKAWKNPLKHKMFFKQFKDLHKDENKKHENKSFVSKLFGRS